MKKLLLTWGAAAMLFAANMNAQDLFPGSDTIPILSWHCIMPNEISVERYQELKDCGFNLSFPHIQKYEVAVKALDCAAAVGIRTLFTCRDLDENPEAVVPKVKNHPGLAGYHLLDEPVKNDFEALKVRNQKIQKLDPDHFTYLNLLPLGATDSFMPYQEYVQVSAQEIPTEFLSYDCYGIVGDQIRSTYFENLEIFSLEARKFGKPFWAFALATAHNAYPIPNTAQLKFQMYCNLAYGAQGLQYFTYWTPTSTQWNFHDGPILADGKRTSVYDMVREVNQELQKRNFVFMRSKVLWVRHTGSMLPRGTTRLTELPEMVTKLDTHGDDAVVSLLEKGDKRYLVIVNASISKTMQLSVATASGVQRVRKDGTIVPAELYSENLIVAPGECEVFASTVEKK